MKSEKTKSKRKAPDSVSNPLSSKRSRTREFSKSKNPCRTKAASPVVAQKSQGESSQANPSSKSSALKGNSSPSRGDIPQAASVAAVNHNLPYRLFPVESLPNGGRLNIYSKPEYLGKLVKLLKGSEAWTWLMASQFRKLFELPVARCYHSAKLIHGMLSRQLVTKKKHELWFVYGGYPLRFSLREFRMTTGLCCRPLPSKDEIDEHQDPAYLSVWNRLFGAKKIITLTDVLDMLREDLTAVGSNRLTTWKKLSLALVVIIDGVVATNNKDGRVTSRYVEMLHDHDFFMSFPWGRESYNQIIKRFGPVFTDDSPNVDELKKRLRQQSSCCYGFPLALQLQIFQNIPAICGKLKGCNDLRNFIQRPSQSLSTNILLRESDINELESLPTLSVQYTPNAYEDLDETEIFWVDEVEDGKVDMIISMITSNHMFKPDEWPLGESPCHIPDAGDDDVIDITPMRKGKTVKVPVGRIPFTRSAKAKKSIKLPPRRNQPSRKTTPKKPGVSAADEQSSSQFATKAELVVLKDWMTEQNAILRDNIRDDMRKLLGKKLQSKFTSA